MGRHLGLVIGVNSYQDVAFRPLQFAETDARALAQWLVNVQGGKWAPSDLQLVLGKQATQELTESLIRQVCVNVAGPGDFVLIYFAGHAFLDEINGEGHLALANTYYDLPATGLHLLSLARYIIGQSRAAQILVILDCFQTGEIWSMRRSSLYDSKPLLGPTLLNALQQGGRRMFLCSCRGNELIPEVGERNLGMLAHRLIVGLNGSARDGATGQVTLQRLHAFLFNALDEQHRPQLFGHGPGQVILVGDTSSVPSSQLSDIQYVQRAASSQLMEEAIERTASTAQLSSRMSSRVTGQLSLLDEEQQRQQNTAMLLKQAQYLLQMQRPAEALNVVEQLLQAEPKDIEALILKGQILGTVGSFQEALSTVEQIIRIDKNNALAWSMRAALLTNTGQFLDALSSVERAIRLDPSKSETHAIKAMIMANLTPTRGGLRSGELSAVSSARRRGGPLSFLIGAGIQLFGLILGTIGAGVPVLHPSTPIYAAFALESLGLAILCVNAVRGAYLYGAARLLLTFLICAIAAGILGGLYKFGYHRLIQAVIAHPPLLGPVLFLGLWLGLAATIPLLITLGALIGGVARGVRRPI